MFSSWGKSQNFLSTINNYNKVGRCDSNIYMHVSVELYVWWLTLGLVLIF